jgi:multidrug efflux pump subunit AcrB
VRKQFPGARIKLYETPPGPPVQAQILAELYGPDYDLLRGAAPEVNKAFEQIYGMVNVDDSVTANADSYRVLVDAEKAMLVRHSDRPGGQVAARLRQRREGRNHACARCARADRHPVAPAARTAQPIRIP